MNFVYFKNIFINTVFIYHYMNLQEKKEKRKNVLAQRHTAGGIREKNKKQRTSFKLHLNNPYTIQWPEITEEDQKIILEKILNLFSFFSNEKNENKLLKKEGLKDKKNTQNTCKDVNDKMPCSDDVFSSCKTDKKESITKYMTLGINKTTKLLEIYSKMGIPSSAPPYLRIFGKNDEKYLSLLKNNKSTDILKVIFVCREDIQHNILYSHFPILCGIVNEVFSKIEASNDNSQQGIRLVTLPKGSEQQLSQAAGLKRLAVMGIMKHTPHAEEIIDYIFKKISPVDIPWLKHPVIFQPTSIIQTPNK